MTKPQGLGEGKRQGDAVSGVVKQLKEIEETDINRYNQIMGLLTKVLMGDREAVKALVKLCEDGVQDNIAAFATLYSLGYNDIPGAEDTVMDYNAEKKANAS